MRARTLWLAGLVAAGLTLAPAAARAQEAGLIPDALTVRAQTPDGQLPDEEVPIPLGHNPNNKGGVYMFAEFVYFRQTNPLERQPIAYQGFFDADGSITGSPGTFVGSGRLALDAKDAGGPGTFQPGLRTGIGYSWKDGTSVDVEWMHLNKAQYWHQATIVPPGFSFGGQLQDAYVSSPVFNFSNDYAGPGNFPVASTAVSPGNILVQGVVVPTVNTTGVNVQKVPNASTSVLYGIWDGADVMTISFVQRTEEIQAKFRVPIFYNDDFCYRMYGTVGPRFFWIWERFYWRTVNEDANGQAGPVDVAIYNNIVSNRMYGAFIGVGNEWYIGHGFACNIDLEAAGLIDVVKERASYELGEKDIPGKIKRALTQYSPVPEVSASFNLTWYPIENVELKLGYDFMAFFNTVASPHPVSFDVGALDPAWVKFTRVFDGFQAGLAIMF